MTEIRTEIEIEAGKETVWEVLTDFAAYPAWNPFPVKVTGRPEAGSTLRLDVRVIGGFTVSLESRVAAATPGRHLRIAGPLAPVAGFLVHGEHYFVIQEQAADRVRFVHGEEFSGALVPVVGWWIQRQLGPAYRAFNEALKSRAEAEARSRRTVG